MFRVQGLAMSQILLEAGYLEATSDLCFTDGDGRYRVMSNLLSPPVLSDPKLRWDADSESEKTSDGDEELRQSVSSYQLDMNVNERVVHLARPSSPQKVENDPDKNKAKKKISVAQEADIDSSVFVDTPPNPSMSDAIPKSGWHRADDVVRNEHEEADSYFRLSSYFNILLGGLLNQLLLSEGLCHSWVPVIIHIAETVVHHVRVEHRGPNAEMDIRKYVQIKKLPGGDRSGIKVIGGVVCSRNVAHRGMKSQIDNARLLILKSALVYQRDEGRIVSLEAIMMQEHEYLRHVVARIASLKPDVVFVHKNVSRLAQNYLLEKGITLVLNVKESVLNRISRMTGAEIIKSVDATLGQPQLGTCKNFFLETFLLDDDSKKTLLFIEGKPENRCTVLLRGSSCYELTKLKKIVLFSILTEYNWRLEKSYLMDEFARPPSPPRQLFQDSPTCSLAEKLAEQKSMVGSRKPLTSVSSVESIAMDSLSEAKADENVRSDDQQFEPADNSDSIYLESHVKNPPNVPEPVPCQCDPLQIEQLDPLQSKWVASSETVRLAVSEIPRKNKFRTSLDDKILSISPLLKLGIPYLESECGQKCALRSYFPKELYASKYFEDQRIDRESKNIDHKVSNRTKNIYDFVEKHDFLTAKFTEEASSAQVQTLLALYRANGGQIPFGTKSVLVKKKSPYLPGPAPSRDVLDPFEHQCFSVLFCCYSSQSENAPAFCVDPWVVTMKSYGRDDIPLGWFLEFYCFRSSAVCRSQTCHQPLNHHMRRFVHDTGALCLSVSSLPKKLDSDDIWMWNWCSICKLSSQRVIMTADTWSLSFAKYLELRFLGDGYTRRGPDGCRHSLHHQHVQYFAQASLAATFSFLPISIKWEISLPPIFITIAPLSDAHDYVDELRLLAIKGHDVFSSIVSNFMELEFLTEEDLHTMKTLQQKEHAIFKLKIEEIQMRLTSPSVEKKTFDPSEAAKELESALWRVEDSISALKRYIIETIFNWNKRFMDSKRKEDRTKRVSDGNVKGQVSPPNEDGRSKDDEELLSVGNDTEEETVWDNSGEVVYTGDSEDNLSMASHQEDARCNDDLRDRRLDEPSTDLKADKKSVKTILSQILTPNKDTSPIQSPWSPLEHYLLPAGVKANVVVKESELSSVIAYALASYDHQRHLEEKKNFQLTAPPTDTYTASPLNKRKTLSSSSSGDKDHQGDLVSPNHCDVLFGDSTCSFSCCIYYAEDFAKFRSLVFRCGEEAYIRSLSHCVAWAAKGGKSGSAFSKTKDDRFVIKQMPKIELNLFLEFAPQYLSYVSRCHDEQKPTLLGKILGVYAITCRNASGPAHRTNLLVMENLFYLRAVTHKYDLKGSMRNRLVNPVGSRDSEIVYMDENLLKMTCDSPLYMMHHSHSILMRAIESDTEFLAGQHVMDYSLLVGLDEHRCELVVGIIDYIRRFTWDKKLENMVKTSVIMGNTGRQPTIIEPKDYRLRFIAAMKRYFLPVPDRWYGFGNVSPL